jgi:two-component system CheB/CheR fusion protein
MPLGLEIMRRTGVVAESLVMTIHRPQPSEVARPRKRRGADERNNRAGFPVVAIGASSGGLGACMKLLAELPRNSGLAFLLVQHLEPDHDSWLVEILGARTPMPVVEATDGMPIECDRVHVIPPGVLLWVDALGVLRLSKPPERKGARLPFDFLLTTLADVFGPRVVCVVLSGSGFDGSVGLRAVKAKGGLVLAQSADEADYAGMPSSAAATGEVDDVLSVAKIAARLVARALGDKGALADGDVLDEIVACLRERTTHDFTHYKRGTLERHVARRMARAALVSGRDYLAWLRRDEAELKTLAREMLINVTAFFRDPAAFAYLAADIVPALVRAHPPDRALRIWSAGCSSGEEAYSLAMLFVEAIDTQKSPVKLQIFGSDVDSEAVAVARAGRYPLSISATVSAERLARFFVADDHGYHVSEDLRASVVFTVHDVLADPPFARIDVIACRNLLIYLLPEAQARVLSLFHFALNRGGLLMLGNSETVGGDEQEFARVSKAARLYRREGGDKARLLGLGPRTGEGLAALPSHATPATLPKRAALEEHCRDSVLALYGPPSVLIDAKAQCLFVQGATDLYLKVASGHTSSDAIGMAREGVATKMRWAVQTAIRTKKRAVSGVGRLKGESGEIAFTVVVDPVPNAGEALFLVSFLARPAHAGKPETPAHAAYLAELERELEDGRVEQQTALRDLEVKSAAQTASYDEAITVNEEYQTRNEELMASKEELQSLNEELNALNSQLHETLERQRTLADDLQNVLNSTDVATIFLDARLNIRFFTPLTKSLFNVIPGDIGRPLTDLKSLAPDNELLADAQHVMDTQVPLEREIEGAEEAWFLRRILPYRTRNSAVQGVVITFADVTERRRTAQALNAAKRQAEQASTAKSRFLAAASHDLRQPLQTLSLIQGLLATSVTGDREKKLVTRFEHGLDTMTGMLNTLLDINQIEVGAVKVAPLDAPVAPLLRRLQLDLTDQAQAKGLKLIVMPCRLSLHTDLPLLEQMLRNLLANALKYTPRGRVLLGCRRRPGKLRIEIWDTGLGIPASELEAIFEEYHQVDNSARELSRGLGLGLSIVRRLGDLLEYPVRVRSRPGQGSVFSIEVPLAENAPSARAVVAARGRATAPASMTQTILIVEDDPEVREYLILFLGEEGYRVESAVDGPAALALLANSKLRPDLVLADYNLPNGLTGVELSTRLRRDLDFAVPFVILTGDISTETLRDVARHDCVQCGKPVKLRDLMRAITKLLEARPTPVALRPAEAAAVVGRRKVFVVDDDPQICGAVAAVLEDSGRTVETYPSCEAFLAGYRPEPDACLLLDAYLPGMSGLDLLQRLRGDDRALPTIMMTGESDVSLAVEAMKAGAVDFIAKPVRRDELIATLDRAGEIAHSAAKTDEWRAAAAAQLADLTPRQVDVMQRVLAGQPSKNIAADLGISQRTVENHRMQIMKRTGCRSVPALARLAVAATRGEAA